MKISTSFLLYFLVLLGNTCYSQISFWSGDTLDFIEPPLFPQENIKHVKVRWAELPSTFLIGCAIGEHKGILYASWATGPEGVKENGPLEHVKVKRSLDQGKTWQDEQVLAPVVDGIYNHSHGSFWSIQDTLNFFTASFTGHTSGIYDGVRIFSTDLFTERFYFEETTQTWVSKGKVIDNFFPMDEPRLLPNGNFIMSGLNKDLKAVVAISSKDRPDHWKTVSLPQKFVKGYPEPTTFVFENKVILFIRNYEHPEDKDYFCYAISEDYGETWSPIQISDFPATRAKPYGGFLTTGRPYLVSNLNGRKWICLSIGAKGTNQFSTIFRLRPGVPPNPSYFNGGGDYTNQQWAYPYVIEYQDHLFIIYHSNKLDAELTIIPLSEIEKIMK